MLLEARAFGIDTLLFGEDALDIYNEEIRNNVFSWTDGTVDEVKNWLKVGKKRNNMKVYLKIIFYLH